jgi:hypothetical protein
MTTLLEWIGILQNAAQSTDAMKKKVTRKASFQAATGFRGPDLPGPGLESVLTRTRSTTRRVDDDPAAAASVADDMAEDVATKATDALMEGA